MYTRLVSMRYLPVVLLTFCPYAKSQDAEQQVKALIEARSRSIAEIDKEFESEIAKLRDNRLRELEEQMVAAMKSLDLERSNALNELMQDWKDFLPKIRRRMVFIRTPETGKPWFFSRGPAGIWIECTPDNLFQHKEIAETAEYIELAHENGIVHRLYDNKNMYRSPEMKDFKLGSRGTWLSEVEIVVPHPK